jgi:glycosyltransferase involved in cell wall biosynthesis
MVHPSHSRLNLHIVWVYSSSLASALDAATWLETVKELRRFGWRVTLVAVGPEGHHQIRGVDVLCIPRPEVYLLRQIIFHARILHLVMKQWATIDVILFHDMSGPWVLPLRLLRWLAGKRWPLLVVDTRSLPMTTLDKESRKDKMRRGAFLVTNNLVNRWADGRLVITPRMAEAVHIPSDKLWGTWPSGVDMEQFAPARNNRHWPSPDASVHLIYHGSLHHERNLLTLCRAVMQANAQEMSFTLTLVGDGTERASLENFAAHPAGVIHVVPPVSYEQIPDLLAKAHVGVLPFPDEEKFRVSSPIKLFEYMAAGLPILATRIACHTDVAGNAGYMFWAEQADVAGLLEALGLVWQNRCSLKSIGSQAVVAAQAWTWHESAAKLKRALEAGVERLESTVETRSG